ncbi:hypothetical protein HN51_016158 [Arachis hypogaea]|nr:uncharacterized protein DS421_6g189560 [Arachis hypogaea]
MEYLWYWGLRFLEVSNPTYIAFEINVSIKLDKSCKEGNHSAGQNAVEHSNPKTRIDKDCSARVLVPLKHFKLPILDDSFFIRDNQAAGRSTSFSQKKPSLMLVSTTLSPGSRFGGIRDAIALSS